MRSDGRLAAGRGLGLLHLRNESLPLSPKGYNLTGALLVHPARCRVVAQRTWASLAMRLVQHQPTLLEHDTLRGGDATGYYQNQPAESGLLATEPSGSQTSRRSVIAAFTIHDSHDSPGQAITNAAAGFSWSWIGSAATCRRHGSPKGETSGDTTAFRKSGPKDASNPRTGLGEMSATVCTQMFVLLSRWAIPDMQVDSPRGLSPEMPCL